jgi:hypothetical protein
MRRSVRGAGPDGPAARELRGSGSVGAEFDSTAGGPAGAGAAERTEET